MQSQPSRQNSGNGVSVPFDLPPPQQPLPSPWETMSGSPSKDDMLSMADLMSPLASLSAEQSNSAGNAAGIDRLFSSEGRPSDKFHAEEGAAVHTHCPIHMQCSNLAKIISWCSLPSDMCISLRLRLEGHMCLMGAAHSVVVMSCKGHFEDYALA